MAGVAQTHSHRRFAWQAWHLWYWVARLVRLCRLGRRAALRGRRGTWLTSTLISRGRRGTNSQPPSFLRGRRDTYGTGWRAWSGFVAWAPRHFAWQAWHLVTSTLISRGRRGTNSQPPSFCVAGVALNGTGWRAWSGFVAWAPRHFAWQAWHLVTSTLISRGRRGTNSQPPSFCVAGVALMVLGGALGPGFVAWAPRHFAWQAWHLVTSTLISRGRRGTN